MKTKKNLGTIGVAAIAIVAVSGCASTGSVQDQAIGTGVGAALGCGVGALITGDARGCATGAAVGALVGFGTVAISQYNAKQVRSASTDARVYGISTAPSSPQVKIRKGSSAPSTVSPGDSVTITTDYSVALPANVSQTAVSEAWVLKKDGKKLADLPTKSAKRSAGGWQSDAEITVPANIEAGTYVIEHRVRAGSSYDTDDSVFVVRA
jgi:methionine-rich copper-binding protein CopC